jgi:membrane-associated phospholipid phosphatase
MNIRTTFFFLCIVASTTNAQTVDSLRVRHERRVLKAFAPPAALITVGILVSRENKLFDRYDVKDFRDKHFSDFHTKVDDYLVNLPLLVVYGLNAVKVRGKNRFIDRSALLIKSEVIATVLSLSLKQLTNELRPDGTNHRSFPSAHAIYAFAAAEFMSKEFKDVSIVYSIAAYSIATTVGVLRVMNDRHWISDVFAGAGMGILATNISYFTHQYRWAEKHHIAFVPSYSNGGTGLYLSYKF